MEEGEKKVKWKAWLALLAVCFFWGTTYLAIRLGLQTDSSVKIHGLVLAATRQSIAGLILVVIMLLCRVPFPRGKTLLQLVTIGFLLLSLGNGLATWSMHYIPSGMASVMSTSGPVFIAILSHYLVSRVNWSFTLILGMALGIVGVLGISWDHKESFHTENFSFGVLLNFLATLVWSLGSVLTAKWKPKVHLLMGAGVQMLFGGAILSLVVLVVGPSQLISGQPPLTFWYSLIYLIFVGSLLAYSSFMYTLEHLPPAQAAIYAYINPVVAVLLGWWFLHEHLNLLTVGSMITTIAGVFLINRSFKKS